VGKRAVKKEVGHRRGKREIGKRNTLENDPQKGGRPHQHDLPPLQEKNTAPKVVSIGEPLS